MTEREEELLQNTPAITTLPVKMDKVNEPILIHEGEFNLKQNSECFTVIGKVFYDWFPTLGSKFSCTVPNVSLFKLLPLFESSERIELTIDGLIFGDAKLIEGADWESGASIAGTVSLAVKGDKSIPVTKVRFAIPNLRSFYGDITRANIGIGDRISRTRVTFENDDYLIFIDKRPRNEFDEFRKELESKGGFIILYSGELIRKKGDIRLDELDNLFRCFSNFLWFLNGRRCSPLFIQGIFENDVIWAEYSRNHVDQHKNVFSWPLRYDIAGLNELWQEFYRIWRTEGDKDFLISAIHWYVEANAVSGFVEGAIIMAQTALELIYNWLLIEKKKLLNGKDAENISASNKIRLLLSYLNVGNEIPDNFTYLRSISEQLKTIDAPDILVRIRNGIVHSQENKRKELVNMADEVKYEALDLSLWYIELSLLFILKFKGKYSDRSSISFSSPVPDEVLVPWMK
jgi:hypothetical protein